MRWDVDARRTYVVIGGIVVASIAAFHSPSVAAVIVFMLVLGNF